MGLHAGETGKPDALCEVVKGDTNGGFDRNSLRIF